MSEVDPIFTVEESAIESRRRGPNIWLVLGGVLAVLFVVLGWRRAKARRIRSEAAAPPPEPPA
jgi:hypothetical protein